MAGAAGSEAPTAAAAFCVAPTVDTARRRLAAQLAAAGIESHALDARLLIGHALGLDHGGLIAAGRRVVEPEETQRIAELAGRRLARVPLAQIIGQREFWGLPLKVTADTLAPRPDTETVVEAALACLDAAGGRDRPLKLADLGTGSGALLLALLSELPRASGIGTDLSAAALAVAQENAARLGLAARCSFLRGDFGTGLKGGFDLVVSNPPYIASADIAGLDPEVRDHEPLLALDGGADGLAAYRAILGDAPRLIRRGGHLAVEIGLGQAPAVTALAAACGLAPVVQRRDLAGLPRCLIFTISADDAVGAAEKSLGLSAERD